MTPLTFPIQVKKGILSIYFEHETKMNILSEIQPPLKISQSAASFLKSLDSLEPDLWQKFTNCSMTNPSQILKEELSRVSPWQSLQHGDSWHNNFLLNKIDVHVVDWQVRIPVPYPSTLNFDLILWHTQLIVCVIKC